MSDNVPRYRKKTTKSGIYAVVTLPDGSGGRRDILLGKHGTSEGRAEYRRVLEKWEALGRKLPSHAGGADMTVAQLIAEFWAWVKSYYKRDDGTPTQEVSGFLYSLRPLNYLYGETKANDFGPIALETVRQLMVKGYAHPKYGEQQALSRNEINKRIKRIRRAFKWAVSKQLIGAEILHGLQALDGLKYGRTEARESKRVLPVARAVVDDTLPLLRPMQADMVRLQLETGMRPGELCAMRAADIDMTGKVWLYKPARHKTAHHGHSRIVPIGPKGQEIIRRYLVVRTEATLFSPAANMQERALSLRVARKTKVQPSQQNRRKNTPRKKPGWAYAVTTYARAIAKAIERHNKGKPETDRIPHWHPHQLRHLRALELKRAAGLDVARAVLGHQSVCQTEDYAGLDIAAAVEVMAKIG
jgi:integrase